MESNVPTSPYHAASIKKPPRRMIAFAQTEGSAGMTAAYRPTKKAMPFGVRKADQGAGAQAIPAIAQNRRCDHCAGLGFRDPCAQPEIDEVASTKDLNAARQPSDFFQQDCEAGHAQKRIEQRGRGKSDGGAEGGFARAGNSEPRNKGEIRTRAHHEREIKSQGRQNDDEIIVHGGSPKSLQSKSGGAQFIAARAAMPILAKGSMFDQLVERHRRHRANTH
jgi:hypothetical protein